MGLVCHMLVEMNLTAAEMPSMCLWDYWFFLFILCVINEDGLSQESGIKKKILKKKKKTAPDPPKYINKGRKWKFFEWKIVSFI